MYQIIDKNILTLNFSQTTAFKNNEFEEGMRILTTAIKSKETR